MPVYIIAEAGVNHNGNLGMAKQLIEAASEAHADAIKFQTFQAKRLVSQYAPKAAYQKETTDATQSQLEMIQQLELSVEDHHILQEHARLHNITFLSSAFDEESVDLLESLAMPLYKIPSGEITNLPLLKKIAALGKPIILSTGMSEMTEIEEAVQCLRQYGASDISLLHCNTQYPTPFQDVNLKTMATLREHFALPVGYSDHTLGITVPVAAVALGAEVIEKHFTLDKNAKGPDHRASLEPNELALMVRMIRETEAALGSNEKQVSASEKENRLIARKSVTAAVLIRQGDLFTEQNLAMKRPGSGLHSKYLDELLGKRAKKAYQADEQIAVNEVSKEECK